MKSRSWLVAVFVVMAVQMSPVLEEVSAQSGPGIVISELRFSGPRGDNDEFIELFNASDADISISRWQVRVSGANSPLNQVRFTIPDNTRVAAGCYYLMAFTRATPTVPGYSGAVPADLTYLSGFGDLGGVAVGPTADTLVDRVGFSTGTAYQEPLIPQNSGYIEGAGLSLLNRSYERRPGGGAGHVDTNNNRADFQFIIPSNPQNSASPCVETSVKPHQVQGSGAASLMVGAVKTVKGVVTARARDGFFIQTEVDEDDDLDNTSEGLFVFTGVGVTVPAAAQVGRLVSVNGTVQEFVPPADPDSAPRTQLRFIRMTDLGGAAMPDAYELTLADLADAGTLDQLERLEGMRVTAPSLTAVSGMASDGVFYAVLTEQFTNHGRPFREPGIEAGYPVPTTCGGTECDIPLFDGNPERLRVDADAIEGIDAVDISTGAVMSGVTGPLDFGSRTYTLFAEAALAPGGMAIANLSAADESLYTVASFNATRFGDVSEATWAAKAALALESMGLPDVVALQGVGNAALAALVAEVDAVYAPVAVAGSDLAFLLKSRVSAESPVLVGTTDLFDRPSVLLRVTVNGPSTSLPQALAVLVNHLEPVNGVFATRQAQANFLADYVHGLQMNNEAFVVVGDFNAFSFNDGYVDTVGTIRGLPAPPNQVAFETFSAVSPALVDLGAQYSFVLNGNAQTHEHVLASANLGSQLAGVARPRINGDFPDAWRHDDTTPARVSAKDPMVASFSFPPDVDAPVIEPAEDVPAVEATGPDGAAVTFATPAATDNLDDVVTVTCAPASGSVFGIGNSGVTCSAMDVAGNEAEDVGFMVTVQDTTAPVITVPDDMTEEATSAEGRVVTYNASASDAVSGSLSASCSPASGSMFRIGTTEVQCLASDTQGNVGEALFSVNISRPVPGRMRGAGTVGAGQQRVSFTFEVGESTNFVERGWLMVHIKDGAGRPRYVAGMVEDVSFSDADGYAPGQWPASGVDTVMFSGVGYWNGQPGYRIAVTASDRGEPGVGNDSFSVVVTSPTGQVVESVSGLLRGGNVQSLR